jgi:hypothetical protein
MDCYLTDARALRILRQSVQTKSGSGCIETRLCPQPDVGGLPPISVAEYIPMDFVEEFMSKRKGDKRCLRANVAQPEDIVTHWTAKMYSNVVSERAN